MKSEQPGRGKIEGHVEPYRIRAGPKKIVTEVSAVGIVFEFEITDLPEEKRHCDVADVVFGENFYNVLPCGSFELYTFNMRASRHVLSVLVLLAVILFCQFSFAEKAKQSARKKQTLTKIELAGQGLNLPVTRWGGKKFIVLEKQKLVRQFGYELYLSPELGVSKKKIDPAWETPQRHVRCDKIERSTLIVKVIKPAGKEHLVEFEHELSGVALFGMTRNGSIEGIAFAVDIDSAIKRWQGATVYSTRRFIDTYDSASGKLDNIKVNIEQPLRVIGVRWGMMPLPPKPLWIMVETQSGEKGFIPTRISWVNAMIDTKNNSAPWEDDILETDPKKLYSWDETIWETVNNHAIATGMNRKQVRMSWGRPKAVLPNASKNAETWVYNAQSLVFVNDSLVSSEGK
jgi:hypothetical protein